MKSFAKNGERVTNQQNFARFSTLFYPSNLCLQKHRVSLDFVFIFLFFTEFYVLENIKFCITFLKKKNKTNQVTVFFTITKWILIKINVQM